MFKNLINKDKISEIKERIFDNPITPVAIVLSTTIVSVIVGTALGNMIVDNYGSKIED